MMKPGLKESTLRFYKERMLRVLVHIQQNLDQPLPLEKLATLACLSQYHFHHVFTGMIGEPLAGHVRRLRLERAASRLKLTNLSVLDVALEAGFDSHEAFSRAFRGSFKASPTAFRNRHSLAPRIAARSGVHYQTNSKVKDFRTIKTKDQTMKLTIKQIEPTRVAFMRHVGTYNKVSITWQKFTMLLGKEGMLGGRAQFIGICHDDPSVTPGAKVRYDACVTVDECFKPENEIGVQVISGGEYAIMTHFGPYDQLGQSYARLLGQWLPRSNRKLRSAPCFEVYFNSPENTEPEDLITDLYAPLEPNS
jgi:AraC family transcriptional regulator